MNALFLAHVSVFALATLACLGSIPRARAVEHPDTRRGLVALLATSGLWAASHVGYLVVPAISLQYWFYTVGLISGLTAVGAWLYFAAAYSGRDPHEVPYRRVLVGVYLLLVTLKMTNPLHHLYFTATQATSPFAHLAIQHGVAHWVAMGIAYSLSGIGFFMLLERFHYAGTETRPLVGLAALTALPIGLNVVGELDDTLLSMTYEPLGVAAFAVGVLFVYFERFQAVRLAGSIDDPVIFLDRGDRIRDFSREAGDLFPELDGAQGEPLETAAPQLADCLDGDELLELERNSETRLYRVTANPFLAGETQTGRSLVISDVTEAEQYRTELEQKNEQLAALNRVVRHDIRNDMTIVLSWGELLRDHVDEDREDALERLLDAANHTVDLTRIAGDFVESLAGEGVPELKPVPLRSYLQTEIEQRRDAYPHAEFRVPDEIPDVAVQANEMLSSVFRNLLNNAVQHNDQEAPVVTVTTDVADETVRVRIADNGSGIPDEQKEEIFGKGKKGLDSEGTGIGLYLVKTLVEQYDGDVWVTDSEPKGSVFVVELQRATTATAGQSLESPPESVESEFGI